MVGVKKQDNSHVIKREVAETAEYERVGIYLVQPGRQLQRYGKADMATEETWNVRDDNSRDVGKWMWRFLENNYVIDALRRVWNR